MRTKKQRGKQADESASWEPFDDCPVCQAMKDGSASTAKGLLAAFAKAKREGKGIVFDGTEIPFSNSHE